MVRTLLPLAALVACAPSPQDTATRGPGPAQNLSDAAKGSAPISEPASVPVNSAPGQRADEVAIGWKTYVYSLATLDCLARVIEENLDGPRPAAPRPRAHTPCPIRSLCVTRR